MMKVGFHIKFSNAEEREEIAETVFSYVKAHSKQLIKRGMKPMNWDIRAGLDADDFVRDVYTIACTAKAFKVPRFVKRYLLQKFYNARLIRRGHTINLKVDRMRGKKEIQEQKVIELISSGMANKQIAKALDKSKHTIDGIVRQLLRKYDCKNRTELAVKSMNPA